MRCIAFELGGRQYVLPLAEIKEVLPMLAMRTLPKAPDYIGGLINYHGQAVPVVDLCQLVNRRPCEARMSSRLLLVRIAAGLLALMVERAVDIVDLPVDAFAPAPVQVDETPYLDGIAVHAPGMPQRLTVARLLPDEVLGLLYPAA